MKRSEVLEQALVLLVTNGWGKGTNYNPATNCYCTIGAIRTALTGEPFGPESEHEYDIADFLLDVWAPPGWESVSGIPVFDVTTFNDKEDTQFREVIEVFGRAIAKAARAEEVV